MHPVDQFEAFAALVAEGRPIEDIAADFSVTPLVVQRRLKLANVSPRLMDGYRADAVTLDRLMALAITDDHAAQEAAFYDAPHWQRNPSALRERLGEFAPDHVNHLGKLKKADIASEAEPLAGGTGSMPAIFKAQGPQEAVLEEGPEEAPAVADEAVEALTA